MRTPTAGHQGCPLWASRSAGSHPHFNRHYALVLATSSVRVEVEVSASITRDVESCRRRLAVGTETASDVEVASQQDPARSPRGCCGTPGGVAQRRAAGSRDRRHKTQPKPTV